MSSDDYFALRTVQDYWDFPERIGLHIHHMHVDDFPPHCGKVTVYMTFWQTLFGRKEHIYKRLYKAIENHKIVGFIIDLEVKNYQMVSKENTYYMHDPSF